MAKSRSKLVDMVRASVSSRPSKPLNWFQKLSPEERAEVLSIKQAWLNGDIVSSQAGLARSIVEECRKAGIKTCGVEGVREWLSKD